MGMEGVGKQEKIGRGLRVLKEIRNWPTWWYTSLESANKSEEKG